MHSRLQSFCKIPQVMSNHIKPPNNICISVLKDRPAPAGHTLLPQHTIDVPRHNSPRLAEFVRRSTVVLTYWVLYFFPNMLVIFFPNMLVHARATGSGSGSHHN